MGLLAHRESGHPPLNTDPPQRSEFFLDELLQAFPVGLVLVRCLDNPSPNTDVHLELDEHGNGNFRPPVEKEREKRERDAEAPR